MTKIYTAGEHVKIVKTDDGYNETLGDQTGLVGTVTRGSNSVYVTFPHTGDQEYYYFGNAVAPAITPTPAPEPEFELEPEEEEVPVVEPLFRAGDKVRFKAGHNEQWTGSLFTITADVVPSGWYTMAPLRFTKPSEALKDEYIVGDTVRVGAHKVELFTQTPQEAALAEVGVQAGDKVKVNDTVIVSAARFVGSVGTVLAHRASSRFLKVNIPVEGERYFYANELDKHTEPEFNVGDWVKVVKYPSNSVWYEQVVQVIGETDAKSSVMKVMGKTALGNPRTGYFLDHELEAAEKPAEHKFKVGDWVKVTGWNTTWNGKVFQIKEVPEEVGGYYRFENAGTNGFSDEYLESAEAPHWTESSPLHTAARVGGRTIIKVEGDKWLYLYHSDDETVKIGTNLYRSNVDTKGLFSGTPELTVPQS